jgi:hypothetical protein
MMKLNSIVNTLGDSCRADEDLNIGQLVDSIENDIFGVLLFIPALIIMLPVSIIPGVSALCAMLVLLSALHILLGKKELWLPARLRSISVDGVKLSATLDKYSRVMDRLDRMTSERWSFMTGGVALKLASIAGILLAAVTIIFGFIPWIDMALMFPVVFFGIAICTGDGLLAFVGWSVLAASAGIYQYFF